MTDASNTSPRVLIVGAGPTGLTLATTLARYGVPARIIEKKPGLSRYTKATNIMQRNQELLAALGLIEPLNAIGGQMRRLMVHAYGKCFGPRTMHLNESPFHDVILCGQHNFERVVADGLHNLGVEIEFDTELTLLSQDGSGATATLVRDGREEQARFDYVVGCDGAAGVTRSFTKHDFTPDKTGVGIRQVDVKLSWKRLSTMEQMWLFYFDQGFAVVVPLPGGVHRVLTIEPKTAFPEREPTLDEMQAKLREVTDDPSLTISDPEWFSYSDLSMGLAPGLRDGRIILAGDVGNPVLPNGGQGMNTGIADAFDLGWKLAAVLKHSGSQALLDTFEAERHAQRDALQKTQFNSLKYTTLVTPKIMQAAFRAFAEPALNRGGEYAMAKAFSQLTQHTRNSPMTLDTVGKKGIRAGERALDSGVNRGFESIHLYDLIYRGGWTLLAFSGRGKATDAATAVQTVAKLGRADLATFTVSTDSRAPAHETMLYDLDEEAHRIYQVIRPTLFLVRPDGHVAARVRPAEIDKLREYLARWLPDASQLFAPVTARSPDRVPAPVDVMAAA